MEAAGAEGRTKRRRSGEPAGRTREAAKSGFPSFMRASHKSQWAFQLTNIPLRTTVEAGDGGYPGSIG